MTSRRNATRSPARWRAARGPVIAIAVVLAAPVAPATDDEVSREKLLAVFQESGVVPDKGGFLIAKGEFPAMRWERPLLVRELWGGILPLRVRWFDAQAREVARADHPGRHAALVEARAPGGMTIRRSMTFFVYDPSKMAEFLKADQARPRAASPLDAVFDALPAAARDECREFAETSLTEALTRREMGAILLAAATELSDAATPQPAPMDRPSVRHQEHHLRVRRAALGIENRHPPLARPAPRETPAPMLHEGDAAAAGMDPEVPDRLHRLCERWLTDGGEPFTLAVARRGVIVFHEAHGTREGARVTVDTAYPIFSLTKGLTGIMLALFLDQGLLDLDAPLGRVLPDFPLEGRHVPTLRQCLMHVTGIPGQSAFGGLDNPWMDNVIANGWEIVKPAYLYSGTACDLAGFAMQTVCGKSVPRLFHEHMFAPLGMKHARVTGLGMGGHLRAIDLARVGQLLLNRGSYGNHTFFSAATYRELLPRAYADLYPAIKPGPNTHYGLGLLFAAETRPRAKSEGGAPADSTILGPNTLGHGSFSGCIFRVDPESEIVIAMGRYASGRDHERFLLELLETVASSLR